MPRHGNILIHIFSAAVFIILETAALSMLRNNGEAQDVWLSRMSHSIGAGVWGKIEGVRRYFSLARENDRLAEKIFLLEQTIREYERKTDMRFSPDSIPEISGTFRYVPASVVKISNNSQHNYLIISKGADCGITEKTGIITDKGVIGIIDAVGKNYSYARSFKNAGMVVSARIGRDGATGSVTWDGISGNGAILREIPQHIRLNEGDTVFTSGFSSVFPPDIPLGVIGEARIENGATYEIKVRLFEDFSKIRYVTLVSNIRESEIRDLEKENEN